MNPEPVLARPALRLLKFAHPQLPAELETRWQRLTNNVDALARRNPRLAVTFAEAIEEALIEVLKASGGAA